MDPFDAQGAEVAFAIVDVALAVVTCVFIAQTVIAGDDGNDKRLVCRAVIKCALMVFLIIGAIVFYVVLTSTPIRSVEQLMIVTFLVADSCFTHFLFALFRFMFAPATNGSVLIVAACAVACVTGRRDRTTQVA